MDNVSEFEVVMLVGGGDGGGQSVMPFASILKSSFNNPRSRMNLQKVYFFWVCHDFASLEWFRSLLLAIEFQDVGTLIEIYPVSIYPFPLLPFSDATFSATEPLTNTLTRVRSSSQQYLTAPFDEAEDTKNLINSAVNGADMMTGLKNTTHMGKPNWVDIIADVRGIHGPDSRIGVFVDGPAPLRREVEHTCRKAEGFVWKGGDF